MASVASFMFGLDILLVATALPTIHRDLHASIEPSSGSSTPTT
jgi:MFS family permease